MLLLLIVSAIGGKALHTSSRKIQSMARIRGAVMDSNAAVIITPKPTIVFKRNKAISRVVANENGDYEITLPPGVYTVTTEIAGFYPFRRAKFRLLRGSDVMINLVPTPRYLIRGTTVSASESIDVPSPAPKYDEFHIRGGEGRLLIQFEKKRIANSEIEYEGAILTYDALTVYADRLSFNKAQLRLKASGKRVVVEDGKQRVQVKRAAVGFKAGKPTLELMR